MSTAAYHGFNGLNSQNTSANGYYTDTTTTSGTLIVGGTAGNTGGSIDSDWWVNRSASTSSTYTYSYAPIINIRRARELMLQLHPQPSFSSWAVQLWEGKLSECLPTGVLNVARVPKQRLYFVFYEGQLLVAAKSLIVAKRCAAVLHLMTPETEPESWTYTA